MKRWVAILLYCARHVLAADALPLDASYPGKVPVPEHANVTLQLPASVMIGEAIPAQLIIHNNGPKPFEISTGGDYRSTGYPQRVKVRVQDSDGQTLPMLPREAYGIGGGGLMGRSTIEPGKSATIGFPLECYVSFTKSGAYSVTVGHDLGWVVDKSRPHPMGTAEIIVREPTHDEAAAMVSAIYGRQADIEPGGTAASHAREMSLVRRLSILRHPVFLSALEERAAAESVAAVRGIGHIATAEATEALLKLLHHRSTGIIEASAREILRRLPSRTNPSQNAHPSSWGSPYQIDPLLPSSWHPKFEQALLDAALKMLAYSEAGVVEAAGLIMRTRAETEHAPAILAALQRSLDVYREPRSGSKANTLDPPKPQRALIEVLDSLRRLGWRTTGSGGTANLVAWFRQLADNTIPKPKEMSWEYSMLTWIENGPATLRICALEAIPQPMPLEYEKPLLRALDDPDWGVMRVACEVAGKLKRAVFARPLAQIIETAHESFVQDAAHRAAVACGARVILWQAWANVILNQERMSDAICRLISGTIDLPDHSGRGFANSNFNRDQRFAMREAWQVFIEEHQSQFAAGKRVHLTDLPTIARLTGMDAKPDNPAYELHLPDGARWPPRQRE